MTVPPPMSPLVGRRAYWHWAATLSVLLTAAVVAVWHRQAVDTGTDHLAVADRGWLSLAAAAAFSTWVCAAVTQQGAVVLRLPAARLLAAQFAASAANHVLPGGLGATTVNWRFLTRCGLTPAATATALVLKATASAVTRGALVTGLALACPGILRLPRVPAAVLLVLVPPCALLVRPVRARARSLLRTVSAEVRTVQAHRGRAAALWGGSLAFAAAHALTVYAVAHALALSVPVARVALAYLAASSAAVLLPTPGGLGSLDAALALALVAIGVPGGAAASTVIGYRLLTAWIPLVPGLAVLFVLARRKAL
ncbi:lysylphosphatidylglycerol synthase domain-containing protein [Streptomyces sp. MS06]|uniref:lysylphosphatidylglycerol synthase domain-containing protein n=1 Tax=Streptomyces sp. MS06 TaxID=3385974 RepID=UPI0039A3C509